MILRETPDGNFGIAIEIFTELFNDAEKAEQLVSQNTDSSSISLNNLMLNGGRELIDTDPELVSKLLFD